MRYTVDYLGDLRTEVIHPDSKEVLITDAPKDNLGLGESFSPTDLFAIAVATCMMTLMGIAAKKLGLNMDGAKMQVDKTMIIDPRRIGAISIEFVCSLVVNQAQKVTLEQAAHQCPVVRSLHPELKLDCQFRWGDV